MNEDKQTNNTAAKTEVPDTEKEALTEEELETVSGGFLRKESVKFSVSMGKILL